MVKILLIMRIFHLIGKFPVFNLVVKWIDKNDSVMYTDLNFASNEQAFSNFFMDFFRNSTGIVNKLKSKIYGFNEIS